MSALRSLRKIRRTSYRVGSALGDAQALASGSPSKVARRVVRKSLWRTLAGLLRRTKL